MYLGFFPKVHFKTVPSITVLQLFMAGALLAFSSHLKIVNLLRTMSWVLFLLLLLIHCTRVYVSFISTKQGSWCWSCLVSFFFNTVIRMTIMNNQKLFICFTVCTTIRNSFIIILLKFKITTVLSRKCVLAVQYRQQQYWQKMSRICKEQCLMVQTNVKTHAKLHTPQ